MSVTVGVQCERDDALRTVQQACQEYGMPIMVRHRQEVDLRRDLYHSVKSRPTKTKEFTIGAMPFISNPNRRELEKAGLREYGEGLAYTATKDWTDQGVGFDDINAERTTVLVGKDTYRIVEKNAHSHFADTFLYVTLSLRRS